MLKRPKDLKGRKSFKRHFYDENEFHFDRKNLRLKIKR